MVGIEHPQPIEIVHGPVREFVVGLAQPARLDNRTMSDAAQREDYRILSQHCQLVGKVEVARIDLRTDGLVVGRQAFHRIGYTAVDQLQAVIG